MDSQNMQQAKDRIQALVDKYKALSSGEINKYTEEETKKDFILPLFEALGWDITNKNEISAEESQLSGGRVDYGFYINGRCKFYLETKSLKTDLYNETFANQAVRYSWNKTVTWAVLTDFESIIVFNAQDIEESLFSKRYFETSYLNYISRFDQLWLLSKEAFKQDLIDKEAEKIGKKLLKVSVDNQLFKTLNEIREDLTSRLKQWNDIKDADLLDEGVQKLLDRLLFIRVAEDRGIEPPTLIQLIRDWENRKDRSIKIYESMVQKFRELDGIYDSNIFSSHTFESWTENGGTQRAIEKLYGKKGYYEYDFKVISADILGKVYENYLGHRLLQSQRGVTVNKDAKKRKKQGIYYTPEFIVDYIVKNALKPVLDKCQSAEDLMKIKVLDPACGSGSFLIKALEVINEKYKEFNYKGDELTKILILQKNLYGVDLDEQAVEIARLNLLLSTLERREKLPKLDKNIKNGNSLISGSDEKLKKYFGKDYRDKKPFNWEEEFPEVFKQGGFDVVIGNPPYGAELTENDKKYFYDISKLSEYQLDTYILFIEKCIELLKTKGRLGFIIPNTWLTNIKVNKFRKFLVEETTINKIVNYSNKVFPEATVDSVTLLLQKDDPKQDHRIDIELVDVVGQKNNKILQSDWRDSPIFNVFTDEASKSTIKKIEVNTKLLSEYCFVTVGIKPYQVGKGSPSQTAGIVEKRSYDSDQKIDSSYRLFIRGRDINRYHLLVNQRQWISYGAWLAEPRNKQFFDAKEKIVIRQTGDSLIATLDKNGLLCLNNLHTITKKKDGVNMYFILGLLNSELLNFYFQYLNPEQGEALAEVKATNVKRLPIKIIDDQNKEIYKKIIQNVKQILDLNEDLQKTETNSNKWNDVKSEIEKTDRKIDEEVYKLYDFTLEEIAIVEGDTKN